MKLPRIAALPVAAAALVLMLACKPVDPTPPHHIRSCTIGTVHIFNIKICNNPHLPPSIINTATPTVSPTAPTSTPVTTTPAPTVTPTIVTGTPTGGTTAPPTSSAPSSSIPPATSITRTTLAPRPTRAHAVTSSAVPAGLANTGAPTGLLVTVGLALLAAGSALAGLGRRRQH